MPKYTYDYYRIDVPSDLSDVPEERAQYAIQLATDHATLFVLPCEWSVLSDDGETCRVRRKRYYHARRGS